ncbi:Metallophosphoesterase domain-containing protein 1 [Seminavis robusta]|uniref:Metallophosphoesterase domain-containing protein 1 n=1 Tax=Seminavis robusta TaxID=568900 RepID=A0A9N8HDN3_9STRA|nr:Metallophosphoesterase domain-containing protein 1 [Seminavis robusta]|eukprot:Sro369_g128220.1 Metallophosphoesterase domain-containing protein 1 (243) ;mRNA; r:43485-44213
MRGIPGSSSSNGEDETAPAIVHQVASSAPLGITIVCISDTHNHHRSIDMPPQANLLIHAGDFTSYGREAHLRDFNEWLGELPYPYKIVVNGNHEYQAEWKLRTKAILSNAIFLKNRTVTLRFGDDKTLCIHGTDFFWPCLEPLQNGEGCLDKIPTDDLDILISHCPVKSFVDCGRGCPALERRIQRRTIQPKVVISGHEHDGRGIAVLTHDDDNSSTVFVNCATSKSMSSRVYGKQPIVLEL